MTYKEIIRKTNRIGKRKGNIIAFMELQLMLEKHKVLMPRDAVEAENRKIAKLRKGGLP